MTGKKKFESGAHKRKVVRDKESQKNKLLRAKETINLRRKFTEKIINEVSNGIIYLDRSPQKTAGYYSNIKEMV